MISRAAGEKAALRRTARARRTAAADPAAAAALAALAPDWLLTRSPAAGYMAVGAEIDPGPLLARLAAAGAALALPLVERRDGAIALKLWRPGEALTPDAFGTPSPLPTTPDAPAPALILAPLLAFDRAGRRLGQGGGHYDRLFAAFPGALRVGLAFAAQEVPALPSEPHDAPLDWVLTEREVIETKARMGASP